MYEPFFGLRECPFDLQPDSRFFVATPTHREAVVAIELGMTRRDGVALLTGSAGTGKTTVADALMAREGKSNAKYIYLDKPAVTRTELQQVLGRALDLSEPAQKSEPDLMAGLIDRLAGLRRRGTTVALIVDQAHTLSDELLEHIRLLTNVDADDQKLLPLILVGQSELGERLNDGVWRPLKQRVKHWCTLMPFDLPETTAYIWSRIRTAGGDATRLFTAEAVLLIHERSRGIPRSISVICHNALMSAFVEQRQPVTRRVVLKVCDELDRSQRVPRATIESRAGFLHLPEAPEGGHSRQTSIRGPSEKQADRLVRPVASARRDPAVVPSMARPRT
jgi:type II secretory pathway predicted ATPase ExeA